MPNGRNPKLGLDCVGVISAALTEMGIPHPDANYALTLGADLYDLMAELLIAVFDRMPPDIPWQTGDILAVREPHMRNHVGVLTENKMCVHAWSGKPMREVLLTPVDPKMRSRVHEIWRFKPLPESA